MVTDRDEALRLLDKLGAPPRLVRHALVVEQTANLVLSGLEKFGISCDAQLVQMGALLHDAGKIKHPQELSEPGSLHEKAGQDLLLSHGVEEELARFCVSHKGWDLPGTKLEDRVVALADKLWKGKRDGDLELSVIDEVAFRLSASRWDVFESLDNLFEDIASRGAEMLEESKRQQSF